MAYMVVSLLQTQLPRLGRCPTNKHRALQLQTHAKAAACLTAKRVVLVVDFAAAIGLAFPEFAYALPVLQPSARPFRQLRRRRGRA